MHDAFEYAHSRAGGVFRWVENGFETDQTIQAKDKDRYDHIMEGRKKCWELGLDLFSTLSQILELV